MTKQKIKKCKFPYVVKQVGEEFYWDNARTAKFYRIEDAQEYCRFLAGIGVETEIEMRNFKPPKIAHYLDPMY